MEKGDTANRILETTAEPPNTLINAEKTKHFGNTGSSLHHDPVLGAVMMHLQRQRSPRVDGKSTLNGQKLSNKGRFP